MASLRAFEVRCARDDDDSWRRVDAYVVAARARRAAATLRALGCRNRFVVSCVSGGDAFDALPVLYLACWRAGAAVAPLDVAGSRDAELRDVIERLDAAVVVAEDAAQAARLAPLAGDRPVKLAAPLCAAAEPGGPLCAAAEPGGALCAAAEPGGALCAAAEPAGPLCAAAEPAGDLGPAVSADDADALAACHFTSGSTGAPKGCLVTRAGLFAYVVPSGMKACP